MTIRVLIADDHNVVRQGLRVFLGQDHELEVVPSEAANGEEALEMARQLKPDVVLMDLLMPGMDGIVATQMIRRELPETEVVILTGSLDDSQAIGAIRAGAVGYLLKDIRADELCLAIKAAASGQVYLASQVAVLLLREIRNPERPATLTARETAVLQLLVQGLSNKEIARDLSLGEKTVKTHVSNILSKLGVQSRTQAALLSVQRGLVPAPSLCP